MFYSSLFCRAHKWFEMKMKVRVTPQKVVTAESSRDAAESRHS
jgi:hypothetical protein